MPRPVLLALAAVATTLSGPVAADSQDSPQNRSTAEAPQADIVQVVKAFLGRVETAFNRDEDLSGFEAELTAMREGRPWLERRWVDYAQAWLRHRQGRDIEAAALLEPLVGAAHHTVPIDHRFHIALAQVYAALDRPAAAQGQWRLALASVDETEAPLDRPWIREGLESMMARGPESIVPDAGLEAGVQMINLGSIVRDRTTARYETAYFEPRDGHEGRAFWVSTYGLDCLDFKTRLLERKIYDAGGRRLRSEQGGEPFSPGNALARHVAEMVCSTPLDGLEPVADPDYYGRFQAFRRALPAAGS